MMLDDTSPSLGHRICGAAFIAFMISATEARLARVCKYFELLMYLTLASIAMPALFSAFNHALFLIGTEK